MYNHKILELEKGIIELISNCELHIGTAALVVNKIDTMMQNTLKGELEKEKQQQGQAEQLIETNEDVEIDME